MSDLRELYQEVILDHGRNPRNFGEIEDADREADGNNPLCGDKIHVYVRLKDGVVEDAKFSGRGCAISTASASLMTEMVKGKTEEEVRALFEKFHDLVTGRSEGNGSDDLEKLSIFAGVRDYPMRVKCATLAWHTVKGALDKLDEVTTE